MGVTKVAIGLVCLLLAASIAFGGRELTTSTEYQQGGAFRIKDTEYTMRVSTTTDSILLEHNGNYTSFRESECREYVDELVCFYKKTSNTSVIMNFYNVSPVVYFSEYINKTAMYAGEEREVTFHINNSGGSTAYNVSLRKYLPAGLDAYGVNGCKLNKGVLSYDGNIDEDVEKSCTFLFRTSAPGEVNITGTLLYDAFGRNHSVEVSPYPVRTRIPFNLTLEVPDGALVLGQTFLVAVHIHNNRTDNFTVRRIGIDAFDEILRLDVKDKYLVMGSKRIRPNSTTSVNITYRAMEVVENLSVPLVMTYKLDDVEYDYQPRFTIDILARTPNFTIYPMGQITSGTPTNLRASYKNLNPYLQYTSATVNISYGSDNKSFVMKQNSYYDFKVDPQAGEHLIFTTITYQDSFSHRYMETLNFTLAVEKLKELIVEKRQEGNTLVLSITNPNTATLSGIRVTDTLLPEAIELTLPGRVQWNTTMPFEATSLVVSNTTVAYKLDGEPARVEKPTVIIAPTEPEPEKVINTTKVIEAVEEEPSTMGNWIWIVNGSILGVIIVVAIMFFRRKPIAPPVEQPVEEPTAPPIETAEENSPEIPEVPGALTVEPETPKATPLLDDEMLEKLKNSNPASLSKEDLGALVSSVDGTLQAVMQRLDLHPDESDKAEDLNEILAQLRAELKKR